MNTLIILSALFCFANCKFVDLSNTDITNLQLTPCGRGNTILLKNVNVRTAGNKKLIAGGTLSTSEDLNSPIKASVDLKKKIFLFWVKVPCEEIGFCEIEDLCRYGIPSNKKCPANIRKNNLPCRCPLKKGTYVFPPAKYAYKENISVLTGKYKGTVTIRNATSTLSCYNIRFTLKQ